MIFVKLLFTLEYYQDGDPDRDGDEGLTVPVELLSVIPQLDGKDYELQGFRRVSFMP